MLNDNPALGWVSMLAMNELHWTYRGTGSFLYEHGRVFPVVLEKRPKGMLRGIKKECYKNSMQAAWSYKLIYADGYAFPKDGIIPVLHAWNVCPTTGKVIDLTWGGGGSYFGLAYTMTFLNKMALETGYYGVIDNWNSQLFQKLFAGKLNARQWRHPIMDKYERHESAEPKPDQSGIGEASPAGGGAHNWTNKVHTSQQRHAG